MSDLIVRAQRIPNFKRSGPAVEVRCGTTRWLFTTAGGKLHKLTAAGEEVVRSNSECLRHFPAKLGQISTGGWDAIIWNDVNEPGGGQGVIGPQGKLYGSHVFSPDVALGRWDVVPTDNGVVMTSPIDRFHGLQMVQTFTIYGPTAFSIGARVRNLSHQTEGVTPEVKDVGSWYIFQADPAEVMLHNVAEAPRHYVFPKPPEGTVTKLSDHSFRLSLNPNGAMIAGEMYKMGAVNLESPEFKAFALAVMGGHKIALKMDAPVSQGKGDYLDGFPFQFYWCGGENRYVELETAGRQTPIKPGEETPECSTYCSLVPDNGNLLALPEDVRSGSF
jgi:hypothetical protein